MAHTPGPWGVFGIAPTYIGAKDNKEGNCLGRVVATTYGFPGVDIAHEESVANARLIAMAPEMLKMCEEIASLLPIPSALIKGRLKAVIAKAKGEK